MAVGLALLAAPAVARAQATSAENQPLPNVLILLDTAGSMELMMDGTTPESGSGACVPKTYASVPNVTANRWGSQVQALTGDLTTYACIDMPRTLSSAFDDEFSYWGGAPPDMNGGSKSGGATQIHPYDLDYYLDFHRPAYPMTDSSGNPILDSGLPVLCAIGFDQSATSGWSTLSTTTHTPGTSDFALAAIKGYEYHSDGTPVYSLNKLVPCTFNQAQNGLLDQAGSAVRFALMTIDSDTNQRTGVTVSGTGSTETFKEVARSSGNPSPDPSVVDLTTGMWSYFNGWDLSSTNASRGRPTGCTTNPVPFFEVGGRNPYAPPWEGAMVRFPASPTSSPDPDPTATNNMVRQAILAMRPYGANPIAGLLDDAKYYYWGDPQGPSGSGIDALAGCRKNYIILLSHAAPNLDLATNISASATCRASYGGGDAGSGANGVCPYDYPEAIAGGMFTGTYSPTPSANMATGAGAPLVGNSVTTFVVGFSLQSGLGSTGGSNGDAGSASTESCNDILLGTAPNFTGVDQSKCGGVGVDSTSFLQTHPEYTSCCQLAKIATAGGSTIPYFADNQQDLAAAFAAILAIVKQGETTRAVPVTMPQTANSLYSDGTQRGAVSAEFVSSFNPSTVSSWNGDVQRQRYQCTQGAGGAWQQQGQSIDFAAGDDFASNIDTSPGSTRYVMVVSPTTAVHSNQQTASLSAIRPWVNGSVSNTGKALDQLDESDGVELMYSYSMSGSGSSAIISNTALPPAALFGSASCPVANPKTQVPFSANDCELIAFDWLMATQQGPSNWPSNFQSFPARYNGGNALSSVSALGGVFHSTPAIATPPSGLLQDDSYQSFVTAYSQSFAQNASFAPEPRHTMLYVATIDGLLHAFGVDYDPKDDYTFNGKGSNKQNERWMFVPPAVMPHLLDGFPKGQAALLDGSPVVKDTVFERTQVNAGFDDWHTSLVAGFGPAGTVSIGGYYALDVTDPEPSDHTQGSPGLASVHRSSNTLPDLPGYMDTSGSIAHHTQGPHFLWQLTAQDPQLLTYTAADGKTVNRVFGAYSATPAITTIVMDNGSGKREVGVAILPGGTNFTAPLSNSTSCVRPTHISDASDPSYKLGARVRNWANDLGAPNHCFDNPSSTVNSLPVPGRTLSIVRLDTGEIVRVFANLNGPDLRDPTTSNLYTSTQFPLFGATVAGASGSNTGTNNAGFAYNGRVTNAQFDSPVTGTPVPYPGDVGAIAQKIFVGDQDGVVWRLDVSNPDPNQWFVEPFYDSFNQGIQSAQGVGDDNTWANSRRPVVDQPRVILGRSGNIVLNWGTGEIANLGQSDGSQNYVYSVGEVASSSGGRLLSNTNWWDALPNLGEMISGPSAVFDSVFYFATFKPPASSGKTCSLGSAFLWGEDYERPSDQSRAGAIQTAAPFKYGGVAELVVGSGSSAQIKQSLDTGTNAVMPGVAVTSTAACAQSTSVPDPYMGGSRFDMQNVQPATYSVQGLVGKTNTTASPVGAQVSEYNYTIANGPRAATVVDSWASIVE